MLKIKVCFILCFLFIFGGSFANDDPPKVGDDAPLWTLQDAKDKEHSLKKLKGKIVFLILGNRKIRKEDDKWAEAFQKDYKNNKHVTAFIIGDLRSVPGFVPKRFVRFQLNRKPPPVKFLLDWKGDVHKKYHTEKKKPNLYLISSKGKIIYHRKINFKPELYTELKKQIDAELKNVP